jgi:TolA-binding protein
MFDYNKNMLGSRRAINTSFKSANEIYKRWQWILIATVFLIALCFNESFADCSSPPTGSYGSSWWSEYSSWCSACGGTPYKSTNSCTPGSNWGRGSSSGGGGNYRPQPSYDWQAEQRRQEQERLRRERARKMRELNAAEEEDRRREEARKKQFEQDKKDALGKLKSGPGQLGLKGVSGREVKFKSTGQSGLKLKEPIFSKGTKSSAPVVLHLKEEGAPLVIDPEDLKSTSQGASTIDKDLPIDVKVDALYRRAVNSYGSGDYDTSIKYYIEALQLKPADRNMQIALGEAMWAKDKKEGNIKKNLKVEFLLDALEYGNGNLDKSIDNVLKIANDRYQAGDKEGITASIEALEIIVNLKKENMDEWMRENDKWLLYNKDIGDVLDNKYPKRTWPGPKNPERH